MLAQRHSATSADGTKLAPRPSLITSVLWRIGVGALVAARTADPQRRSSAALSRGKTLNAFLSKILARSAALSAAASM